jgi:hypothetical protein
MNRGRQFYKVSEEVQQPSMSLTQTYVLVTAVLFLDTVENRERKAGANPTTS